MKKLYKILIVIGLLNVVACTGALFPLPDAVPIHINSQGIIDAYGSKWFILIFSSVPMLAPLFLLIYRHYTKTTKNQRVEGILVAMTCVMTMVLGWVTYAIAASGVPIQKPAPFPVELMIGLPISLMVIILGNYMGIIKPNFYMGIRTPWTLSSKEVWVRTHRMGGYTMVLGGIIMLGSCIAGFFIPINGLFMWGTLVGLVIGALVPCAYSFVIYAKMQRQGKV